MQGLLSTWEFWAGVLLAGLASLGTLLRWTLLGDGRTPTPTRLSSIQSPPHFRQPPLAHAHPDAAVARLLSDPLPEAVPPTDSTVASP